MTKLPSTDTGACGTDKGYYRHRYKGEQTCLDCRKAHAEDTKTRKVRSMTPKLPPTDTGACGTSKGAKRHWVKGESACKPCREADRVRRFGPRPEEPARPTLDEIAVEIQFFLRCGEGTHAILKAIGYQGRHRTLQTRLRKGGMDHINQALFGEAA